MICLSSLEAGEYTIRRRSFGLVSLPYFYNQILKDPIFPFPPFPTPQV